MSDTPQPIETGDTTFDLADVGMAQSVFNMVSRYDEIEVRHVPASGKYIFERVEE